jgi:acyl-lipid omega-6 desaturase (Delta-12 desaturase)
VAEVLMRAVGILALSASSVWRSSHNHHHNHNSKLRGSQIGAFPVMTRAQFTQASRGDRWRYLAMRHPITILFGYLPIFLMGMCINPFFNNPKKHADCLASLLVHIGIGIGLYLWGGWQQVILTQTLPHFIACAIGSYLFYAQHNFPGVTLNEKDGWTYEKASLESSSFLETGPIMGWFTANIGYHHIHHLNAKIPFYRLPEIMRAMPELQHPRATSLHPRDIAHCLRLKVWDVDLQRLIGFREMALPPKATTPAPAFQSEIR